VSRELKDFLFLMFGYLTHETRLLDFSLLAVESG
jgi:hypothetical protein